MTDERTGIERIAAERQRQIDAEGWTPAHDDEHTDASLALAAICYAAPVKMFRQRLYANGVTFEDAWPTSWRPCYDKRFQYGECRDTPSNVHPEPSTYTADERLDLLVKAGALIAAEIDRLQRRTK